MRLFKFLLKTGVILAAILGIMGLFAKKNYHIERSVEIEAPKALVYDHVRKFSNFDKWSPWNELDPTAQKTYTGVDGEPGATFAWKGNEEFGEGKMTVLSVTPDQVNLLMDVTQPLTIRFPASYTITGDSVKTRVTFSIDPIFNFPTNVWAMFTDVNRAFGRDFERGLGNLKKRTERLSRPKYRGFDVEQTDVAERLYVGVRDTVSFDSLPAFFAAQRGLLGRAVARYELDTIGPMSCIFWVWDTVKMETQLSAVLPVTAIKKAPDSLSLFSLPAGRAAVIEYRGDYKNSEAPHLAMDDYLAAKKLAFLPHIVEEYVGNPLYEPDSTKWLTRVIYYLKPPADSLPAKK